jgi:citrate synthase
MDPLKEKFYQKSVALKADIKSIVKEHGDKIVDQVTVEQLIGGMRSVKSMIWDTSSLDPEEGIRFRGYNIPQLRELLPRVPNGKEPLPEGLFWLMMTGELPTTDEVRWLSAEWSRRSGVAEHVFDTIKALPKDTHPMTQFSIAILSMQSDSIFAQRYEEGMSKNDYWDAMYEDSMNMIASLP